MLGIRQRYCYAVRRDEEREGGRVALFQVMPELGPGLDRVERREIDLEVLEEALHKCHDVDTTVERIGLLGTLQDAERLVSVMDRQGHGMETYLNDSRRVALNAILGENLRTLSSLSSSPAPIESYLSRAQLAPELP